MNAPEPDRCERCGHPLDGLGTRGRCPGCGLRFDLRANLYPEGWRRWARRRTLLDRIDLIGAVLGVILLAVLTAVLLQRCVGI